MVKAWGTLSVTKERGSYSNLRIDVIILGVSSSASLILVPAEAATARRRKLDSMDLARCGMS